MTTTRPDWEDLPRTEFGGPEMEERLAALILAGRKRATVWAGRWGATTKVGDRAVVTVHDRPVAVIETTAVYRSTFDAIDEAFAVKEGEGDLSLAYWRAGHEAFFRTEGDFDPAMDLWCEEFRLVETLDLALAARAAEHVEAEIADARALLAERAGD